MSSDLGAHDSVRFKKSATSAAVSPQVQRGKTGRAAGEAETTPYQYPKRIPNPKLDTYPICAFGLHGRISAGADLHGNLQVYRRADRRTPYADLILDPAGNLYGTTFSGGSSGSGTVYTLDRSGNETVAQFVRCHFCHIV